MSFTCADVLSGVAVCPPAVGVATEGVGQTISGTAIDRAGNSASVGVTLNIDKTAPLVAGVPSPAPNAAGWSNSDVTVAFRCSDQLSGIVACMRPQRLTGDGAGQTVAGVAADLAGNTATATRAGERCSPSAGCKSVPAASSSRSDFSFCYSAAIKLCKLS